MNRRMTVLKGVLLISMAGGLLACGATQGTEESSRQSYPPLWLSQFTHRAIALKELPDIAPGTTVYLEGTVAQQTPLLESNLYQLVDETGEVWVRSRTSAPTVGEFIKIRGVVQTEVIVLEGIDISEIYVNEADRQVIKKK